MGSCGRGRGHGLISVRASGRGMRARARIWSNKCEGIGARAWRRGHEDTGQGHGAGGEGMGVRAWGRG